MSLFLSTYANDVTQNWRETFRTENIANYVYYNRLV